MTEINFLSLRFENAEIYIYLWPIVGPLAVEGKFITMLESKWIYSNSPEMFIHTVDGVENKEKIYFFSYIHCYFIVLWVEEDSPERDTPGKWEGFS